ncbi:MAG: PAS domain-containing protein, partial [Halobacteriales archaeon]
MAGDRIEILYAGPAAEAGRVASRLERQRAPFAVTAASRRAAVLDAVDRGADCVVCGGRLADAGPIDLLRAVRARAPDLPFVLVPAGGDESLAAAAVSAGATDYLPRGGDPTRATDGVPYDELADRIADAVAATGGESREALAAELTEVLERLSAGFFAVDDDCRFTYVNERAGELLGVDGAEVVGERVWTVFGDDAGTRFREKYREAMASQRPVGFEARYDPLSTWFDVRAYPSETGLSVYFRDVTDRKDRERQLQRAERQFEAAFHNPSAFMWLLDPDGTVRRVNEVALSFLGAEEAEVVGERFPDTPWWDHSAALGDRLAEWIRLAREGEYVRFEERFHAPDGDAATVDGMLHPVTDDGEVVAIFASGLDVTERKRRERQLERQREQLAALNDITSLVHRVGEAVVRQSERAEIERLVCSELADSDSYEFAWLADVDPGGSVATRVRAGDSGFVEAAVGEDGRLPPDAPPVVAARTGRMQVTADLAGGDGGAWRERAFDRGYRSAAAVPITYEASLYGVLSVYSGRAGAFGEEERTAFERLGTIIAHAVRSVRRERQLRESEERYRTLAENVPDGIVAMVDEDLQCRLAAGSALERLSIEAAVLEGRRMDEVDALPADVRATLTAGFEAALSGDRTTREVAFEDRVFEVRTIPIRRAGAVRGAMSLSQDVTERVRRERDLERERERLELLNRLIRHNLLNSLNVVEARLEFVERYVDPEASDHLATARTRTAEMVDLIETIRGLMAAIGDERDHDLEPIRLPEVLAAEVEAAAATYPGAAFELGDVPDVAVRADDLLSEAVENLLVNAVQHNDADRPSVRVTVEDRGETAVVAVADNGPGVPDD